jgi:hypothetical protein
MNKPIKNAQTPMLKINKATGKSVLSGLGVGDVLAVC